jgi:hypothetical protein
MKLFLNGWWYTPSQKKARKIHLVKRVEDRLHYATKKPDGYRYVYTECGQSYGYWKRDSGKTRQAHLFDNLEQEPENQVCKACLNKLSRLNRKKSKIEAVVPGEHTLQELQVPNEKSLIRRIITSDEQVQD